MSKLKDPYDYIEWNPDLNHQKPIALNYGEEKKRRRKRTGRVSEPWIGYIYDLIVLFTLATVVATLLKLLFN